MPEPDRPLGLSDAEQFNERLHRFAHALKNRLGSIWQAAALLHDVPAGAERAQLLAMAEKNYFQGARELEELLDDLAVPRGITRLHLQPVELGDLVRRCIGHIGFRTAKKQQEVRFQPTGAFPVQGDPQVLEQLFEALLSNASKFSPKGSLIHVALYAEGHRVVVEVRDHGTGLSGADLQDVFTRYAMLGSRSTDGESQARSTLARARQWAVLHGGSLLAFSKGPGQGAVFTVELPLAQADPRPRKA